MTQRQNSQHSYQIKGGPNFPYLERGLVEDLYTIRVSTAALGQFRGWKNSGTSHKMSSLRNPSWKTWKVC